MSNRRPPISATEALDTYIGKRVDGGCPDCHSDQTLTRDEHGTYHLWISHDYTCPFLNRITTTKESP